MTQKQKERAIACIKLAIELAGDGGPMPFTKKEYELMYRFLDENWQYHQFIEKACEYLKSLVYQEFGGGPLERTFSDEDIEEFKKAIEE